MAERDPAEAQADALVADIARQLAQATARIEADAAAEAAKIRRQAVDKTRRRVRQAIDELRAIEHRRLEQVRAEIDTERRRHAAAAARQWLDAAWPRLTDALGRRWSDPAARAIWIDATLALAAARLAASSWTIRHPAGSGVAELLRQALARHVAVTATLVADAALAAGLVVEADGARLDASAAALVEDRPALEAELLAAAARCQAPGKEGGRDG